MDNTNTLLISQKLEAIIEILKKKFPDNVASEILKEIVKIEIS